MTYNVLLHPEIQTTSRTNLKPILEVLTAATTNTLPGEFNLRYGYAGTVVERINDFCKREDARNGVDQEEQARKRKEMADLHIVGNKKRITAGLLASAKLFALGPNFLAATQQREKRQDDVIHAKGVKSHKNLRPLK